jgi:hypothetical protein
MMGLRAKAGLRGRRAFAIPAKTPEEVIAATLASADRSIGQTLKKKKGLTGFVRTLLIDF